MVHFYSGRYHITARKLALVKIKFVSPDCLAQYIGPTVGSETTYLLFADARAAIIF